jgi:hypothetical protein
MFFNLDSQTLAHKSDEIARKIALKASEKDEIKKLKKLPQNLFPKDKEVTEVQRAFDNQIINKNEEIKTLQDQLEFIEGELEAQKQKEAATLKNKIAAALTATCKIPKKDMEKGLSLLPEIENFAAWCDENADMAQDGNKLFEHLGIDHRVAEPLEEHLGKAWRGFRFGRVMKLPNFSDKDKLETSWSILEQKPSYRDKRKKIADELASKFAIDVPGPVFAWTPMTDKEIKDLHDSMQPAFQHDHAHLNKLVEKQNQRRREEAMRAAMPPGASIRNIVRFGPPEEKAA